MTADELDALSKTIIGVALHVHTMVGPGCLESVYEKLMFKELLRIGLRAERQKAIPATINGIEFAEAFKADLVVENSIIVEIKSAQKFSPVDESQLLTYLRLADSRLGLLFNFGERRLRHGIKRVVNNF